MYDMYNAMTSSSTRKQQTPVFQLPEKQENTEKTLIQNCHVQRLLFFNKNTMNHSLPFPRPFYFRDQYQVNLGPARRLL